MAQFAFIVALSRARRSARELGRRRLVLRCARCARLPTSAGQRSSPGSPVVVAWPFALGRLKGAAAAHAGQRQQGARRFPRLPDGRRGGDVGGDQSRAGLPLGQPTGDASMPIEVLMPALSPTMEKGNLAKWLKKEGDAVKSGDVIAEIETDKATMEVEAVDEGTLGKILVPEGTNDVAVNTPIAMILAEGEDAAALKDGKPPARKAADASPTRPCRSGSKNPDPQRRGGRSARAARRRCRRRAAEAGAGARARRAGRHRDGHHDGARGVARRHGGGDAPRQGRVRDGRGGRRVSGRLQGHPGPAAGIRRHARDRHADHRARLRRARRRRGDRRPQADRRVHDLQFRHAGDGPAHQFGGQDALHVGRPDGLLDRVPRAERAGGARRRPAQPGLSRPGTRTFRASR